MVIVDPDPVGITDSNPVGKEGPLRTVPALRALRPTVTNSSYFSPLLSRRQFTPLTSLAATLMDCPRKCCKHKTYGTAKSFRCNTYKKPGVGVSFPIWKDLHGSAPRTHLLTQVLSFHTLAHSFAFIKNSTPSFSNVSALFAQNHPGGGLSPESGRC